MWKPEPGIYFNAMYKNIQNKIICINGIKTKLGYFNSNSMGDVILLVYTCGSDDQRLLKSYRIES